LIEVLPSSRVRGLVDPGRGRTGRHRGPRAPIHLVEGTPIRCRRCLSGQPILPGQSPFSHASSHHSDRRRPLHPRAGRPKRTFDPHGPCLVGQHRHQSLLLERQDRDQRGDQPGPVPRAPKTRRRADEAAHRAASDALLPAIRSSGAAISGRSADRRRCRWMT
jgi:hypothetical protein